MKNEYSNIKQRAGAYRGLRLLPVLMLPLMVMAVPAPSYIGYMGELKSEEVVQREFEDRKKLRAEWNALGPVEDYLKRLEAQSSTLKGMIPAWQEEVVAHGAIRKAAVDAGFALERVRLVEPEPRSKPLLGNVLVERMATISGSGDNTAGLRVVEMLRTQGWPVVLHAMDLVCSPDPIDPSTHEIKLGLFHYASAERFAASPKIEGKSSTKVEVQIP